MPTIELKPQHRTIADFNAERAAALARYTKVIQKSGNVNDDDRLRQGPNARPVILVDILHPVTKKPVEMNVSEAAAFLGKQKGEIRSAIGKGCKCGPTHVKWKKGAALVRVGTGTEKKVFRRRGDKYEEYFGVREASRETGVPASTICQRLRDQGSDKKIDGWTWGYVNTPIEIKPFVGRFVVDRQLSLFAAV